MRFSRRSQCSAERAPVTSHNASENTWTLEHLGPHTFHLQLYGATRAAQEPAPYLGPGRCAWRFDFDAKAAGRLGFQVHHVYEVRDSRIAFSFCIYTRAQHYKGYMNVDGPPPLTKWTPLIDSPVGFPTPLDPTAWSHHEQMYVPEDDMCPEPSLLHSHILRVALPPIVARPLLKHWRTPAQLATKANAPLCSRHEPVPGVFRQVHPSDMRKSLASYRGYVWETEPECVSRPPGCPYLLYLPLTSQLSAWTSYRTMTRNPPIFWTN